jgi:hypothetical protein
MSRVPISIVSVVAPQALATGLTAQGRFQVAEKTNAWIIKEGT